MARINRRVDARISVPTTNLGKPKKKKEKSLPPHSIELANIIFDRLHEYNPRLALTSQLSSLTGLRYSDCSWLKYDDFYDEYGNFKSSFSVCQQKTFGMRIGRKKNPLNEDEAFRKSLCTVYTSPEIEELVEESRFFSNGSEFLFANPRSKKVLDNGQVIERPMSVESASEIHKKVQDDLKLDFKLGTHSWRKFFALMLIQQGATVVEIRDLLGQDSLASTNAYLEPILDVLKNHISNLSLHKKDRDEEEQNRRVSIRTDHNY